MAAEQQQRGQEIDLGALHDEIAAGKGEIVKVNGIPHYTKMLYDRETGAPDPVIVRLDRQQLVDLIATNKKSTEAAEAMVQIMDDATEAAKIAAPK